VFVIMLAAAKFGQHLFFELHTSPAILWPPTGIAIAIMWIGGYRFAFPIFLGLLAASVTGPTGHLIPGVITTPFGQVLGQAATVYFLKRQGFDGTLTTLRNVWTFIAVIALTCMIAPTITIGVSWLAGTLSTIPYLSWTRAWAGYILSALILTPFILTLSSAHNAGSRRPVWERIMVSLLVVLSVYFLFWTRLASQFSFLFFALFFIAHFWVGYRFTPRAMTYAIFSSALFGLVGLFVSPAPTGLLNERLFASELFFFLVIPMFYSFSALIKERAHRVEELREAMSRIERESRIKNEFIAVLAHELRNPLAPVKTTLEILSLQDLPSDIDQLVKNSHRQIHAMRRMLDDLLDITRVTQGKFQLQLGHARLSVMIKICIDAMQPIFDERGQHVTITPAVPDESIRLDVDPVRFEQAITNILSNASKYTPRGGHISISYATQGASALITIQDNGIGVEQENLQEIFKPFWQVQRMPSASGAGIGVGLSLTKHIVEMHGGSISAESAGRNAGTTITVKMPLSHTSSSVSENAQTALSPSSCSVLIVDDNKTAADSLAMLLRLKGHTAKVAYSGTDVFECLKDFNPMIILLDIGLPDMNGYEIAQRLRAQGFAHKIVALSGFGQKEDKDKARAAGFDYHMTKPMGIERFEEYLRDLQSVQPMLF
jgi:signal transduction histidine kinase/ActR/RegA family two-component response regulator